MNALNRHTPEVTPDDPVTEADWLEACRRWLENAEAFRATLPKPPPEFALLVDDELAEARRRAMRSAPLPIVEHVRTGSRWSPDQTQVVRRSPGRCGACGCDLDDQTVGCGNCGSRHAMRRLGARRRALRLADPADGQ